jgi:hypothetical protein
MRSKRLTATLVVAAASMLLACAAASAASFHRGRHARPDLGSRGSCRLTLTVASRLVYAGESVSAYGRLLCGRNGEVNSVPVTLYERSAPATTYTVAGEGTTEATGGKGSYDIEVKDLTTNSDFYAVADGVRSAYRAVGVLAEVKLAEKLLPAVLLTGRSDAVTFKGSVSPTDKGALVVLQRQNALRGNEWRRIGAGQVSEAGTFEIRHIFRVAGPSNIRVVLRDPGVSRPSPSNILTYEIEQAQNPELVIASSANPISYGQSTTISGTAAVPAGTTLKLFARPARHGGPFTQVAETKTEGAGTSTKYMFPSQMPLVSTLYKVEGAGKTSATLYQGVKYLLTTSISPGTTVKQGEPVTFSGTIKPGVAHHVVYLERENAAKTAFHVIEVGEVIPPSPMQPEYTFSITHAFYDVGTSVVRIRIPGDPQYGATVSEPFTIQVNAAPPFTLTPESPGNSTPPSEGQI